jgi:hypothetical protein
VHNTVQSQLAEQQIYCPTAEAFAHSNLVVRIRDPGLQILIQRAVLGGAEEPTTVSAASSPGRDGTSAAARIAGAKPVADGRKAKNPACRAIRPSAEPRH